MFPALKHWKLIGLGLLVILLLIQTVRVESAKRSADKWKAQSEKQAEVIRQLEEAGKAQQRETARVVVKWRERVVASRPRIAKVENAPLPGQCRTPTHVLEEVE